MGEQRSVDLLADQDVVELVYQLGEFRAVGRSPGGGIPAGRNRREVGFGQDDDVIPAQAALSPAWVALDVFRQCVAGFTSLPNRFDVRVLAAAELAPAGTVVPDLTALDLEADYACALDGDDKVDLVVLEMVSHALTGDDEVGFELLVEGLVDAALGAVGEARCFGGSDGHGNNPATTPRKCSTSAVEGCISKVCK